MWSKYFYIGKVSKFIFLMMGQWNRLIKKTNFELEKHPLTIWYE